MSCNSNGTGGVQCSTIQILEPDNTLLTATSSGSADQALDESGVETLATGESEVSVVFQTQKLSNNFRFEYLYVDAFGLTNPGTIHPVPIVQTQFGFTVDLAGAPPLAGYLLRWRAVVVGIELPPGLVDTPENLYLQLPQANNFRITFNNPWSTVTYGFTELRVENLVDGANLQTPILVQVVQKRNTDFLIALSPTPPSNHYYIAVRTP